MTDDRVYDPEAASSTHSTWTCTACAAVNSDRDGQCQFCECGGEQCLRDSCDDPRHKTSATTAIEEAQRACEAVGVSWPATGECAHGYRRGAICPWCQE